MTKRNGTAHFTPPSGRAMREFSTSVNRLIEDDEKLHEQYRDKWIAIYKGNIEAVSDTFEGVTADLVGKDIPTADALVRFMGQKEMTLIL